MPKVSGKSQASTAWAVPNIPQFLLEADKAETWLVPGLFYVGSVGLCSGQKKLARKSYFTLTTAIGMAAGVPFGLWKPKDKIPTLYALQEGPKKPTGHRIRAICRSLQVDPNTLTNLYLAHMHGIKLDSKDWQARLIGFSKAHGIKCIFLDPIGYMHSGDENKTQDMQKLRETIDELLALGITVVLIHHLTKNPDPKIDVNEQVRGSGVISDKFDTHIALRRYGNTAPTVDLELRFKDGTDKRLNVRWRFDNEDDGEGGQKVVFAQMTIENPAEAREKQRRECISLLRISRVYSATSLAATWGLGTKQTKLLIEDLCESATLTPVEGGWTLRMNGAMPPVASVDPASHGEPVEKKRARVSVDA